MRLRKKHFAIPEMEVNPYIFLRPEELKGKWQDQFKNKRPIHLEIGAGRGGFAVELARRNPHINYLAMDMESNVFVYAGRRIQEAGLENLYGILGHGENLEEYFQAEQIERIYINFCNPWPKPRQHKRRLIHPRLLEVYKKVLKPGAEIQVKTDDLGLYEAGLEYFPEAGFEILESCSDLGLNEDSIVTDYEKKWRGQGIKIKYIRARFPGKI
ncbi:MAG: tRNA (guanosine(46)-N7)-methyltransferase TrmB [Bacillota bacterium]|nr:tRNA (guanosine(46)-N7)-methyltransferase TrmB [Bacillota bacterium]